MANTSDLAHALSVRLRRLHIRVTPQRLSVLLALAAQGGHLTAEQILQLTRRHYPTINLATIYRTLDMLVAAGVVAQTDLGGGASMFELIGETPHHHLICDQCGAMIALDDTLLASLRQQLRERYGFDAYFRHIAIFGLCAACQAKEQASQQPPAVR